MAGLKKTRIKKKKERKQIKKENRVAKNLLLLNPGNLAKEVYTYGYHFSWKTPVSYTHLTLPTNSLV